MLKHIGFLLIILFIISSCQQTREQASLPPAVSANSDSMDYKVNSYNREIGDCTTDTSAYCTRVQIMYPEFSSGKYAAQASRINKVVTNTLLKPFYPDTVENRNIENFTSQFFKDYQEIKSSFGEAIGWYAKANTEVMRNDSLVLCLEITTDLYTGGAHGNVNVQYLNFNPSTGNLLTLDSILVKGYKSKLNQLVEQKFRKLQNIDPESDLSDEGFLFENEQYYKEDNFALLEEGIKFYYNNYEIAPYSSGSFEVLVDYEEIQGLLKEGKVL